MSKDQVIESDQEKEARRKKFLTCRHCGFVARSQNAKKYHLKNEHPREGNAKKEEHEKKISQRKSSTEKQAITEESEASQVTGGNDNDVVKFSCKHCGKAFDTRRARGRHYTSVHPRLPRETTHEPEVDEEVEETAKDDDRKPVETTPVSCECPVVGCSMTFESRHAAKKHLKKAKGKAHKDYKAENSLFIPHQNVDDESAQKGAKIEDANVKSVKQGNKKTKRKQKKKADAPQESDVVGIENSESHSSSIVCRLCEETVTGANKNAAYKNLQRHLKKSHPKKQKGENEKKLTE